MSDLPFSVLAQAQEGLARGQRLEAESTAESLRQAVVSYDRALSSLGDRDARGQSEGGRDAPGASRLRQLLWINRGNALTALARQTSEVETAREAVRSYDETLALIGAAATDGEAAEAGLTAGAAWLNRAAAIRLTLGDAGRDEEGRDLENAIARLTPLAGAHAPARINLAGAWMNRAAWLRAGGDVAAAIAAWRGAIQAAASEAGRVAAMLELTLRARHSICVALGETLAEVAPNENSSVAFEAARHLETGLAEFAEWRGAAEGSRPTAARLFEFGAWLARTRRPAVLARFLAAHADPADPLRVEIARGAIHLARQEILAMDFSDLLGEAGAERRAILQDLGAVETRLAEAPRARE